MKMYTLLLAMVSILFLTNCQSSESSADSGQTQQTQEQIAMQVQEEQAEQAQGEVETVEIGTVWTLDEEVMSGNEIGMKKGTATFLNGNKVKVKNSTVDGTYAYKYVDEGAGVELKSVDNKAKGLYFMVSDAGEGYKVWEGMENEVESIWTLTEQ
ncbi:MAG: hypothetical protein ACI97N_002697 [Cognaticolwellia sp.]|jgi:hypothetical protein